MRTTESEQATGDRDVDARTDVYALGCVLYEMLVSEPPYTGGTAQAVLGQILTGDPVWATKKRASVPANVDAAIRKALEKLPADRFTGAQDFAKALADPGFRHGEEAVAGVGGGVGQWKRVSALGWSVAALTTLTTVGLAWSLLSPEPRPLARFELTFGEDSGIPPNVASVTFALSPDGSQIVYVGPGPSGGVQLWQRALDDLEPDLIPGTEGALAPVVSPDGLSVLFATEGGVKRTVSLAGGPAFTVVESRNLSSAWGSDGMIYFTRENAIYRVPTTGGEPEAFTFPTEGANHRWPEALPDGRGLLLTAFRPNQDLSRIAVVGPEGGEVREILAGTMARYAASGHLVYSTVERTLMAVPFDLKRLEVTGPAVALLDGVEVRGTSASQFALSETGTLLYKTGGANDYELVWVSREGAVEQVDPAWTGDFRHPALSPDGSRLAVVMPGSESTDIWVKQLDRGPRLRLTFEGNLGGDRPTWTPDGASVTFRSNRAGTSWDLWTKRADGSAQAVLELDRERGVVEALWSPNGEWLIYRTDATGPGSGDILALRPGQDTVPLELLSTGFTERHATLSPDGRWLAYMSNETGTLEIYVVPFPNAGDAKWAVSTSGGWQPVWSHSGRELFYLSEQGEMFMVEVNTEPTFSAGPPEVLFAGAEFRLSANAQRTYDVSSDDQRFIMMRRAGGTDDAKLILVQNFFEELKRLVPN